MMKNRIFGVITAAALVGLAACGPEEEAGIEGEAEATATTVTPIVDTETQMAPVVTPVTTTDTGLVRTTVEAEVDREVIDPANAGVGEAGPVVVPTP